MRLSIPRMILWGLILFVTGCDAPINFSKDDFLAELSIRRRIDDQELVVTVAADVDQPDLWVKYDLFVITKSGQQRSLLTNETQLKSAANTHRFALEDLSEIDRDKLPVGIYYIAFRGQPDEGRQLFCGTVSVETDLKMSSSSPEE